MKEFEEDDPLELQAVLMPGDLERQARFIIEEFSSMGMPKSSLIDLFKDPFYMGVHHLFQRLGEAKILQLIQECNVGVFTARVITK